MVAEADQEQAGLSLSLSLGRASRASHVLKDKSDAFGRGSESAGGDDHPSLGMMKVGSAGKNHGELERFLSCPPQSNYRVSHQTPSGYLPGEYGHPFKRCCGVPHLTSPALLPPCKKPRYSDHQDSGYGSRGQCVAGTFHTTSPTRAPNASTIASREDDRKRNQRDGIGIRDESGSTQNAVCVSNREWTEWEDGEGVLV